jgi:hypothetical protein
MPQADGTLGYAQTLTHAVTEEMAVLLVDKTLFYMQFCLE